MLHYDYIIWDWNGTLLNDIHLSIQSINTVLSKRQMPTLNPDSYRALFGFPVKDYYARIGFDFERESFAIVGTEFINYYNQHQSEAPLNNHAKATLQALKNKGIGQSVLSARMATNLKLELTHYGIAHYFDHISGLDNHYAESKLHNGQQLVTQLETQHGISPQRILLVGDTLHDAEVAHALGIQCTLLTTGHQNHNQLQQASVPLISSLTELLD